MKKSDGQNILKEYIIVGTAFLVAILAALVTFFCFVQKDIDINIEDTVSDSVAMQSHQLKTILDSQYDYLDGVAAYLGQMEELISDESMKLIRSVQEKSGLERVSIIDTEGTSYYDNGTIKSVASRRYFQEGISGQRTLSDPLESKTDGATRVVLGVPVWKDDQVVGVLGGSYNVSSLSRMLFQNIYGGEGFSFILKENGDVVSFDASENSLGIQPETNFFLNFADMFEMDDMLETMKLDFLSGQIGYVHLKLQGGKEHLAYAPLGYNGWMVCYTVAVSKAQEAYAFINEYELVLCSFFSLSVLLLLLVVLRLNAKKQRNLLRYANTDSLTGLFNRKHTEEQIQERLMKNPEGHRTQAFIIMDIDFFKEINDIYGHAVGDEVLRCVGQALRTLFGEKDIVGRIGGDEFVIFLGDAGSREEAEKKAASIPLLIRRINAAELKGRTITCSIGMSVAPDDGQDYLELYKCADIAMYETKKKGRNGYTVYQKAVEETEQPSAGYVRRAYTEINPLTGLYYNKAFLKMVDERLKHTEKDACVLVAVDIEHFRLFNRLYGREAGDRLLIGIADALKEIRTEYGGIAGYLSGDNFCIFMPDSPEALEKLQQKVSATVRQWNSSVGFLPGFGVYRVNDPTVSAAIMYDRATMALNRVYGNYASRVSFFETGMIRKMEEELLLLSDVQEGLDKQEFIFYVQPQCNISGGKPRIVGGECLVRWKHGENGLTTPGAFIPCLEKNGFVAELDRYIWRKVCQWMGSWIQRGHTPVPVSVNVSRIDIFSMDVPAYFGKLIAAFGLNPRLIKIEITESAYAENDERISQTVKKLREAGFSVMMDDFGSGYSSLSMLQNVSVDVLKMDMRFLGIGERREDRGIRILESVVNMTRQMGLPIIVEGIETKKQEVFLANMGCRYVQGYYYYKPMPVEEFEQLIQDEDNLDLTGFISSQAASLHFGTGKTPGEKEGNIRDCLPVTTIMTIYNIEQWLKQKDQLQINDIMPHVSDGFFVYIASGHHEIIYANPVVLKLFGCASLEELLEHTGGSFDGMVHPDDLQRVNREIEEQIARSGQKMDYIEYRIIRRDGTVIHVDDYGHREDSEEYGDLFYVFISESERQSAASEAENR